MMMKKLILLGCMTCLLLTGCASTPMSGSYLGAQTSEAAQKRVSDDVCHKLTSLYAPGSTSFQVAATGNDAFGAQLVAGLRAKGFAIREAGDNAGSGGSVSGSVSGSVGGSGLRLVYLVDSQNDLIRVQLAIGDRTVISRAYLVAADGSVSAAGAWAKRE